MLACLAEERVRCRLVRLSWLPAAPEERNACIAAAYCGLAEGWNFFTFARRLAMNFSLILWELMLRGLSYREFICTGDTCGDCLI